MKSHRAPTHPFLLLTCWLFWIIVSCVHLTCHPRAPSAGQTSKQHQEETLPVVNRVCVFLCPLKLISSSMPGLGSMSHYSFLSVSCVFALCLLRKITLIGTQKWTAVMTAVMIFNSRLSLLCLSKFTNYFWSFYIVQLITRLRCGKGKITISYIRLGFNGGGGFDVVGRLCRRDDIVGV